MPTSSAEATISSFQTNSQRFSAADPFMTDMVEVWRFQAVGTEEGEPQMARVLVATIRGRVDELRSRHTDSAFRTNISDIKQDYGMIFLPVGSNVLTNDQLRAQGQDFQIISINVAPGAFGPHHLEVFVDRILGQV